MKTRIYTPSDRKTARTLEAIYGDCLEKAGLNIPHKAYAIIDCSIAPKVGDLVHCNNSHGTVSGFIKQVKLLKKKEVGRSEEKTKSVLDIGRCIVFHSRIS